MMRLSFQQSQVCSSTLWHKFTSSDKILKGKTSESHFPRLWNMYIVNCYEYLHIYIMLTIIKSCTCARSRTSIPCSHISWLLEKSMSYWTWKMSRGAQARLWEWGYCGRSGRRWVFWSDRNALMCSFLYLLQSFTINQWIWSCNYCHHQNPAVALELDIWWRINAMTFQSLLRSVMTKTTFIAENERRPGYTNVLLITTGSVASIKAPLIASELLQVHPYLWITPKY